MSFEEKLRTISLPAGGDLSAAQYKFVMIAADDSQVDVAADHGPSVGILQNKPKAAGQTAEIATGGVSKAFVDADGVTVGDIIGIGAAGGVETAEASDVEYGIALATGTSGQVVAVLFNCENVPGVHA